MIELTVKSLGSYADEIQDLVFGATKDDENYAQSLGFNDFETALSTSALFAEYLIGVYWDELCVALVGISSPGLKTRSQRVWVHTSSLIREEKEAIKDVIPKVMSKVVYLTQGNPLYAHYRKIGSIQKLAELAGFTNQKSDVYESGMPHEIAWR